MKIQVFSTPQCVTCPAAKKLVKKVIKDFEGIDYEEVDALQQQEMAFSLGVTAVPAIAIDGKLWKIGVPSKDELVKEIKKRLGK
jgi:small redox-active disulfide protein 1